MQNSGDNVFDRIPVATDEPSRFKRFLTSHDLSAQSGKALILDMRKLARWFSTANAEPFTGGRVTVRDVTDFKDYLRRDQGHAVATVNRCLVTLR